MLKQCRQFAAITVLSLFPLCSATLQADDWPMEGANSQRTGATPEELPEKLELLWERKFEGLGFDAGPIVADGVVYANDHDGRVYAVDLESGEDIWSIATDSGFIATPSYRDGVLYVTDFDGLVYALDAKTGKEKWRFETQGEIKVGPNFFEDSLLVTSEDGGLYCVSLEGEELWKYEIDQPIMCGASLADNRTFVGGCDEFLHVIDVSTGKQAGDPIKIGFTGSTPAVSSQLIIAPNQAGGIFALKRTDSSEQWFVLDEKLSDEFRNSVAISDGIIVGTGRNKRVFALKLDNGEVLWTKMLRMQSKASPIIAGKSVFVASGDGRITRYDLRTGEELWMYEVKRGFQGPPAAADGKLVLANDRGSIFCFGEKK